MRRKSAVWKYFYRDDTHAPNIKAKCRKCGHTFQGIISRMEAHLLSHPEEQENNSDVEITGTDSDIMENGSIGPKRKRNEDNGSYSLFNQSTSSSSSALAVNGLSELSLEDSEENSEDHNTEDNSSLNLSSTLLGELNNGPLIRSSSPISGNSIAGNMKSSKSLKEQIAISKSSVTSDNKSLSAGRGILRTHRSESSRSFISKIRMADLSKHTHSNSLLNNSVGGTSSASSLTDSPSSKTPARNALSIAESFISTTKPQLYRLHLQTARFFASTLSPFTHVEDPQFIHLWQLLRPGTNPPNRHQLSGELLDVVFNEERTKILALVEGKRATLSIDGWSNITNNPVLGVSVGIIGYSSYFLQAIDTTNMPHTSDQLLSWAKESITSAEEEFRVKIVGMATDGAANMVKMREHLAANILSNDSKSFFVYGCQAHLLNLISKELDKIYSDSTSKVLEVVKFLRNKHAAVGALIAAGLPKPPIPAETRWTTLRETLRYYSCHCGKLQDLVAALPREGPKKSDKPRKVSTVQAILEDPALRRNVECILAILDPVCNSLNVLQSDNSNIAEAYFQFLKLEEVFNHRSEEERAAFLRHGNKTLRSSMFRAAYLLEPKFRGAELQPESLDDAVQFVINLRPNALNLRQALTSYVANMPPYDSRTFQRDSPVWWIAGKRIGFDNDLAEIAQDLGSCICNSAGLERSFSTMRVTYGELRSNLDVSRAGKLTFLHRILSKE